MAKSSRRVAVIGGLRTPFLKSTTGYQELSTLQLAQSVVNEMMQRLALKGADVDALIYGQVIASPSTPNIAREIVLGTPLPRDIDCYSVSRACATSTQAAVNGARAILLGEADVVICGGADSLSRPPITYSDNVIKALMAATQARTPLDKAKAFMGLAPKDLLPSPPALQEMSTGLSMGQSAEKMAQENGIDRAAQDAFALRSHQRAAEAWETGVFAGEVMPYRLPPKFEQVIEKDGLVRPDTTLEKLEKLRPVFDKRYGTITAATSSPLTDGASAVVLMSERKAKSLGYEPLAYIRSWGFAGLDVAWQALMGPSFASPKALDAAGMELADIDLIDMHEAFAAQVLSNTQAFASDAFAQQHLGRKRALGEVDPERLNIYGGSIALGHPFAATGTRQILTMANELNRRNGGTALITQCAAGGLGAAIILER